MFQWQHPKTAKWGFFDGEIPFVNGKWSPPMSELSTARVLGALNGKLHLELNFANDPFGYNWWLTNALKQSRYEHHDVTAPAFVGPNEHVRAAAARKSPVGHGNLLAQINNMTVEPFNRGKGSGRGSGSGGGGRGSGSGGGGRGSGKEHDASSSGGAPSHVRLGGAPTAKRSKQTGYKWCAL